jgi:signal transduction histidine kinase
MSSIRKANAALAAAVIFLLLSSCAAYVAIARLNTSERWVRHTRDVQSAMAQFAMVTSRAGRLRAEYVDSGDLSILQRQAEVVSELRSARDSIQRLSADNTIQQADCRKLQDLTEQRISLMDASIELKKTGKSTLETQAPITRNIVATAAETDTLLQHMYESEEQLLAERQARVRRSSDLTVAILIASVFLALILFLIHHRLLMSQVTARTRAEMSQRALSARLLTLQDEERRKFARELHDSVGQHLAAMKMGISMLQSKLPGDTIVKDCIKLLDDSISETRTISHLLHPPLLDEAGLNSASRWFVEGFGKRSGIETNLDMRDGADRLPESIELVLFRVLQESLTNVHRHSGAKRADVSLNTVGNSVVLRIKDYGKGMPAQVLQNLRESGAGQGVGLAGMTERIHEIGGRLEINSGASGTEIVARVPSGRKLSQQKQPPPAAMQKVTG